MVSAMQRHAEVDRLLVLYAQSTTAEMGLIQKTEEAGKNCKAEKTLKKLEKTPENAEKK